MSEEKVKVVDLAKTLGKQSKDIIAVAKELGIVAAKAANSTLSEQEVGRIRSHVTGESDKRDDVIVRRRPKGGVTEKPLTVSKDAPTAEKSIDSQETPSAPEEEKNSVKVEKAKEVKASSQPENKKPASARIVKRVDDAPTPEVVKEEPKKVLKEPKKFSEEKVKKVEEPAVQSTAKVVDAGSKKQPSEKIADSQKGGARVVRPAAFSAEPERNADGHAVSSTPVLAPRSDIESEESTSSSVRVISRPTPQETRNNAARPRQDGNRSNTGRNDSNGNRPPRSGDSRGGDSRGGDSRGDNRPVRPARPASTPPSGPTNRMFEPFVPTGDGGEQGRKKRQKGRRTVEFNSGGGRGEDESIWNKASSRRHKGRKSREVQPKGGTQPVKAVKRKIKVEEFIRVSDIAHQMGLKSGEIIKILFNLGVMATINQSLDIETATLVAIEFGYEIEKVGFSEDDVFEAQNIAEDDPDKLVPRPPVVTIMGHVDHGKTSLLDAIRKSSVVSGEAGGITQHIGAYHVVTKKGEIVFLDTPGHEAFTAMRARGAEVTDLVVLVVAADDGVMEQTKEAINHSRAAGVPIMVAVNKIDKPGAEPDRVKRELSENGLVAEDWGGDTVFSYVSAKTREGLDDLLELLALQAEILELKANPDRPAVGHIVEAKLDKGRGSLGTVLIQQGTLRTGDAFVCGIHSGRVRAMFDDQGKKVKEATPSMPVEVQGFEGVPEAGEEFISLPDEKTARRIAEARALKQRERVLAKESKVTLETFLASSASDVEAIVLNLVAKADVQGSLEAIIEAVNKLSTEKVRINVIHGGTGAVSESDVLLASASQAIILGFNVRPSVKAKELAEQEKVDIRYYDIIYKLVEEIKSAMEGMLAPVSKEVALGTADVRETFSVPKIGLVAGCHVSDGKIVRNCSVRLLRDGIVVHTGTLGSLRRFKDDVKEVTKGYECGLGLENYNDIKVGDVIEAFEVVEEAARL